MSFGDISFSSCVTWGSRSFNPVCIADTNQSNAEKRRTNERDCLSVLENEKKPHGALLWRLLINQLRRKITRQTARTLKSCVCLTFVWPSDPDRWEKHWRHAHPICVGNISTSVFPTQKQYYYWCCYDNKTWLLSRISECVNFKAPSKPSFVLIETWVALYDSLKFWHMLFVLALSLSKKVTRTNILICAL